MRLVDDLSVSRLMLTVQPGEDLIAALEALAFAEGWTDAFVTGAGVLELCELTQRTGMPSTTVENAELTALSGRVRKGGERCFAVLRAAVVHEGRQLAGRIEAAITGEMLIVVDARGGTAPRASVARTAAVPPPLPPTTPPLPPVQPRSSPPPGDDDAFKPLSQSFSQKPVIRRLHDEVSDEDESHAHEVEIGDLLEHPQLGLCEVVGDDGSGGTQIRMSSGRVRTLKLEALHVMAGSPNESGQRIFRVAGPRRR